MLKSVPVDATLTPTPACSDAALADAFQPGPALYPRSRYADYELFARIVGAGSSLIARVKDNAAYVVQEERSITAAAQTAGVVRDVVIARLGTDHAKTT